MFFVVSIRMDFCIRIRIPGSCTRITIQASPTLAVLKDNHFARKHIRMIQDALYETPDEVAIRAPSVFPLSIDLYEDDILWSDQSRRATECCFHRRLIKFQPFAPHHREESIHSNMTIILLLCIERIIGNSFDPKQIVKGLS